MKTFAIIAAVAGIALASTAQAMPNGNPAGGPIKQGNYCWVATDGLGHGWWDACDSSSRTPRGRSLRGVPESNPFANTNGGGGGGGGGGSR